MPQDDHSHECGKDVAFLTVTLSDATIISVPSNNSTENDISKTVLHAFTTARKVKKKHLGNVVHSIMSGRPAVGRRRSTEELVDLFSNMIQKDQRMKKAKITKISDVMEFDPDTHSWDIPAGTPPMTPFSVDYSKTAHTMCCISSAG